MFIRLENIMSGRILLGAALLVPLVTFAQSESALRNANEHASFLRAEQAPEIDGGSAVLGLALLGGIISLVVKKNKQNRRDD